MDINIYIIVHFCRYNLIYNYIFYYVFINKRIYILFEEISEILKVRMYDVVVCVDIVDGHSKILDRSIKSSAFSDSFEPNDYVCSFYNNKHPDNSFKSTSQQDKRSIQDDKEFETIYCLGCFKFPWFRRKDLSVSESIRSFQNKNLDLLMRMKKTFINLVD